MEDIILDNSAIQQDKTSIKYGGFWQRFAAIILDWLVLAPVSLGVSYLNMSSWKSSALMVLISLIGLGYKPFMEYRYGASLGKMAMKLKVRNLEFEDATLGAILLRNIFQIIPGVISLFFSIAMYNDPGFASVSGFGDFTNLSQQYVAAQYINYGFGFLALIDAIVLAADYRKRSIHDKIGGTVVISTN
jgi:uncharacterized RDD family membrane protein YckC